MEPASNGTATGTETDVTDSGGHVSTGNTRQTLVKLFAKLRGQKKLNNSKNNILIDAEVVEYPTIPEVMQKKRGRYYTLEEFVGGDYGETITRRVDAVDRLLSGQEPIVCAECLRLSSCFATTKLADFSFVTSQRHWLQRRHARRIDTRSDQRQEV
jgi:hypothetical protein